MNEYKVQCKCGHVGKRNYIPITFPIIANNAKEAAEIARYKPRVKHDHKDAILSVKRISKEEADYIRHINDNDPYLKCNNIQEQNLLDLEERLVPDPHYKESDKEEHRGSITNKVIRYKKLCIKKPKRFFRNIMYEDKMEELTW